MDSGPRVVDLQSLIVATPRSSKAVASGHFRLSGGVATPLLCLIRHHFLQSESRKLHNGHSSRLLHRC